MRVLFVLKRVRHARRLARDFNPALLVHRCALAASLDTSGVDAVGFDASEAVLVVSDPDLSEASTSAGGKRRGEREKAHRRLRFPHAWGQEAVLVLITLTSFGIRLIGLHGILLTDVGVTVQIFPAALRKRTRLLVGRNSACRLWKRCSFAVRRCCSIVLSEGVWHQSLGVSAVFGGAVVTRVRLVRVANQRVTARSSSLGVFDALNHVRVTFASSGGSVVQKGRVQFGGLPDPIDVNLEGSSEDEEDDPVQNIIVS